MFGQKYGNKSNTRSPIISRIVVIYFHVSTFFSPFRNIKNAVIGNKAKKSSFIRLDVIPKIIELLVQDDTGIEFIVESVVLLGSLARGT